MKFYTIGALIGLLLLAGCVQDSSGTVGISNFTDFSQLPAAVNNDSGGWAGIGLLLAIGLTVLSILSINNKREEALNISLFVCFVSSLILASIDAVVNSMPTILLALLAASFLYSFLKK